MVDKLRVYARGEGSVPHYESASPAHGSAPQRRISHVHEPTLGPRFIDDAGRVRHHGAWVKKVGEAIEVPATGEYIRHLRDGDLWPADEKTATVIGFPFYLKGQQLESELARGSVPHRWRDVAEAAIKSDRSFYEQAKAFCDEEHGAAAVEEHKKALAEVSQSFKTDPPAKPKAVIV